MISKDEISCVDRERRIEMNNSELDTVLLECWDECWWRMLVSMIRTCAAGMSVGEREEGQHREGFTYDVRHVSEQPPLVSPSTEPRTAESKKKTNPLTGKWER
jgi:hypothetical protein